MSGHGGVHREWNGGRVALEPLALAIEMEARLLGELIGVLRHQRDGVLAYDVRRVGESVFAAHRVLHTAGEARRRRRTLAGMLAGTGAVRVDQLDAVLGAAMTPRLRDACRELQRVAAALGREVALNHRAVRRAGARALQSVQTGSSSVTPGRP